MAQEYIKVHKAKVHNLKNVSVDIPKRKFSVITGPSGSGKSSLAFDTIYAEGQRRYVESLSSYARQFLGQMDPPEVESIEGLSPAIAIDQKSTSKNPRSTVGTITEIYDYLRLLYGRLAVPYCPESGDILEAQSPEQIVQTILKWQDKTKIHIMAPIARNKKGEYKDDFSKYLGLGFSRVRVNGEILSLGDEIKLEKNKKHNIDIVIDRVLLKKESKSRLTDSIEQALRFGDGHLVVLKGDENEEFYFSEKLYSKKSDKSYPDLEPRLFSFNSPIGACVDCNGLGTKKMFIKDRMINDQNLSINEGAISVLARKSSFIFNMVKCIAKTEKVSLDRSYKSLPQKFKDLLFHGSSNVYSYKFTSDNSVWEFKKAFSGLLSWLERKYYETGSDRVKADLEKYMHIEVCPTCRGGRLTPYALAAKINGMGIDEVSNLSLEECADFISKIKFKGHQKKISEKVLKEINNRLNFLLEVGLSYLTLKREAGTLSGGESQRIRLATQIGSALSGVIYVLDEPSIGLHQVDNDRLIGTLKSLRDLGNTVVVVEHDQDTMEQADYIFDIGPGSGIHGGEIVASGTPSQVKKSKNSITGKFLSGKLSIDYPEQRRILNEKIVLKGARKNNIKSINVDIPLGGMTCVVGVSGSGKSTLIHGVLVPAVKNFLSRSKNFKENYDSITGVDVIDSIIELDQSPIGRTPKSNPATYSGLFDDVRKLYASTNEAKMKGYGPGRFSFNVKGGRCETCEGAGVIKVEMNFLPDVYVKCDTCKGKRYNSETLNIYYRNKNISDVLQMSIEEASEFFENHSKIARILNVMKSIGLGYMKLGQPSTTLSGGEAQRMKLSRELSKKTRGHCLYILDEPTTGLHFQDISLLITALNKLVDQGNSVLIIEHNLDVIKCSDYLIEMGPGGGDKGGKVVAKGAPEKLALSKKSPTGKYIAKLLH